MQENISKVRQPRHRDIFVALGLGVFSVLLYFCSFSHQFTFDDLNHIQTNPLLANFSLSEIFTSPTWPGNLYRPVFTSSLAFAYKFSQLDPFLFHLGNVLQNAFVVIVLFYLINILFGFKLAFSTALLFACHPIHVEAVANVSHRSELMAALFGLLAIVCALKNKNFLLLLFLFLSFCCKESALTFLVLIPLSVWSHTNKFDFKQSALSLIPLAAYLGLRVNALGGLFADSEKPFYVVNPLAHIDPISRIASSLTNLGYYLVNLLIPFNLSPDYSFSHLGPIDWGSPFTKLYFLVLVTFLFLLFFGLRNKNSIVSFFAFWFFLSFAVTSNILFPIGTIFADRLAFLPSVSVCGLISFALLKISHDFTRISLLGVIVVLFSAQTMFLQKIWESNETLYSYAIERVPESAKTQQNYGIVCLNQGRFDNAALHFSLALKIYPHYADVAYRMSFVYREKGLPKGVEHWLNKALEISPNHTPALADLGILLTSQNRLIEAKPLLLQALKKKPNDQLLRAALTHVESGISNESELEEGSESIP